MALFNQVDSYESVGKLFVVATPIGNLGDITHRAVQMLQSADWIAAEDTRHTKQLLTALGIQNRLISLHEHNERQRAEALLQKLVAGEQGVLVSDAGTPLINDPGYYLVKLLREHNIPVIPVPGVSAVITALSCAGLPTNRFTYEGFLPARNSKRLECLNALEKETRTMVFYESPHRLTASITAMLAVFGPDREAVIGRELTKKFEQFVSGSLQEVVDYFVNNPDRVRGEFVVMVAGVEVSDDLAAEARVDADKMIHVMLAQQLPVKQISTMVAQLTSSKKNMIYQRVLALKEGLTEA